ncbi:MAG: DNA repair protein RecO [Rhodospirillaceae bacterium]
MQWSAEGIVVAVRAHGETSAVVALLTRDHGRHAGLARGGAGRRGRGVYQVGNVVAATWRARLGEHLGTYACELVRAHAADLLSEALPLAALNAVAAVVETALPEREPHPALYDATLAMVAALHEPGWAPAYVRWEVALLAELGFGLDLAACALTGAAADLAYVSPRTGRAVSRAAAAPYRDRLLALPPFLADAAAAATPAAVRDGLALTGHFLDRDVFAAHGRTAPAARDRLVDGLRRLATISGRMDVPHGS